MPSEESMYSAKNANNTITIPICNPSSKITSILPKNRTFAAGSNRVDTYRYIHGNSPLRLNHAQKRGKGPTGTAPEKTGGLLSRPVYKSPFITIKCVFIPDKGYVNFMLIFSGTGRAKQGGRRCPPLLPCHCPVIDIPPAVNIRFFNTSNPFRVYSLNFNLVWTILE
jgi:hypothetical protein